MLTSPSQKNPSLKPVSCDTQLASAYRKYAVLYIILFTRGGKADLTVVGLFLCVEPTTSHITTRSTLTRSTRKRL